MNRSTLCSAAAFACSVVLAACSAGRPTFAPLPATGDAAIAVPHATASVTLDLAGPLPSAKTANVTAKPGTTAKVPVPSCNSAKGCSIKVTVPVGKIKLAVTIVDAKNNTLATSLPLTATIKTGANTVKVQFVKTIATLTWGTIPAGTSGTAFATAGKPVKVTAKDADGNAIAGTYAHPITLADGDKTGATSFTVNAKAATSVAASTDALTLKYSGLAISPATLSASSTGVKTATATFTPSIAGVVSTCTTGNGCNPNGSTNPEIDLITTTPSASGFSGSFGATQAGWTGSFGKAFTYAFAAVNGFTNDCPTVSKSAFSVTPASGTTGSSFTVSAAAANAGECMMTITGGGGKTLKALLTFTTTGVGVSARRAP